MRIIVVGASGTIGREVAKTLEKRHEVMTAGRTSGDFRVDISRPESIEMLYRQVVTFDAVICAAGAARFGKFAELTEEDYQFSLRNKLLGQVNLVRIGRRTINYNGSFTLTSGILAQEPMPGSTAVSMVNAGIEGFVRAAALELDRGVRVNVVSPVWVQETLVAMGRDRATGMPAAQVAHAYAAAVEGAHNGDVLDVREFVRW